MKQPVRARFCSLVLVGLLALLPLLPQSARADTVRFAGLSVDTDATYVDLGDLVIANNQWDDFYAFLSALPKLEKVDLFSTPIRYERIEDLHQRFPGFFSATPIP